MQVVSKQLADAISRFAEYAELTLDRLTIGENARVFGVHQVHVGDSRYVFVRADDAESATSVAAALRERRDSIFSDPAVYEFVVGLEGATNTADEVVARGVKVVALQHAVALMVGLPLQWSRAQKRLADQVLRPLLHAGELRVGALNVSGPDIPTQPVDSWLGRIFDGAGGLREGLLYVRAEAGKGKSTTLANHVRQRLEAPVIPLPLLVPLRQLDAGGVSWEVIARSLGVVSTSAQALLAAASRAGLVALALDGLDEVAGRYEPTTVREVVDVVRQLLASPHSLVLLSGRTTESGLLPTSTLQVNIELPDVSSPEFSAYVANIADNVVPGWPSLIRKLPEPHFSTVDLVERDFTTEERRKVLEWVQLNFASLGKERSLFFVQSLICTARTYQLDGNQPLVIDSRLQTPGRVYDACILAASLACVREQEKIDAHARDIFSPSGQLDVLTQLAVLASADNAAMALMPRPNTLVRAGFDVDPVNQSEQFTSILRQIQKHALLFAQGETFLAGEWRAAFLSEWIRCALLARAWRNQESLSTTLPAIRKAVVCAQRAQIAFSAIFPELLRDNQAGVADLIRELVDAATEGNPDACANYWALVSALGQSAIESLASPHKAVVDMTDLSSFEFESISFANTFTPNLVVMVAATFMGCSFRACRFTQCDLTQAVFTDCTFDDTQFSHCYGSIRFENCRFSRSEFLDAKSDTYPAVVFVDCHFDAQTRFKQNASSTTGDSFGAVVRLEKCTSIETAADIFSGHWLGLHTAELDGLERVEDVAPTPRELAQRCLTRLLRTFFPSSVGDPEGRQARGYIRVSAIGRGAMPPGSPEPSELKNVLESEGFKSGGRADHLYAPWSSVLGAPAGSTALRNELSAFVRHGTESGSVRRMLARIEQCARWK